jgi:DNA-binding response OmpR family regulator
VRILVLEDHRDLRAQVANHLTELGFKVDAVGTMEEARAALSVATYDLAVLDLGLPDGDGRRLLGELPALTGTDLPAIIMTARDSPEERLACLNGGADDYLPKPFSLLELEARLRAVLRRPRARQRLGCGTLSYDPHSRDAIVAGVSLELSRRESELLEALLRAPGRVITRTFLGEQLYPRGERASPNALEAVVSRLRRRLRDGNVGLRLETSRGIGYRLATSAEIETSGNP